MGQEGVEVWIHGAGGSDVRRVDLAVSTQSGDPLDPARLPRITLADRALRIFTSGTTGLPKAAEVSHRKLILWTHWFAGLAGFTAEDRHYNCLPMHHSVGGVVAVGAPLVFGGAAVISERFSGRGFWDDVSRWRCTAFQYVGELCRYLVAAPERSSEQNHGLRIAIGNGLAELVWRSFVERFGPIRILEFYASTEGNVWLYNVEGKMGSIGRIPAYLAARRPLALARFDHEFETPARGPDGLCEPCADGEVGEALGRISDDPGSRFEGYSEEKETGQKDPAERVQGRRRLDAHGRSHAARLPGFFHVCRSHRRYVSLEGRKRLGSRGCFRPQLLLWRGRGDRLWGRDRGR